MKNFQRWVTWVRWITKVWQKCCFSNNISMKDTLYSLKLMFLNKKRQCSLVNSMTILYQSLFLITTKNVLEEGHQDFGTHGKCLGPQFDRTCGSEDPDWKILAPSLSKIYRLSLFHYPPPPNFNRTPPPAHSREIDLDPNGNDYQNSRSSFCCRNNLCQYILYVQKCPRNRTTNKKFKIWRKKWAKSYTKAQKAQNMILSRRFWWPIPDSGRSMPYMGVGI